MNRVQLSNEQGLSLATRLLTVESSAILGLRTSIRSLPLLALYSEGINKQSFPIPAFGFWSESERASSIEALFLSHRDLLLLSAPQYFDADKESSNTSPSRVYLAVDDAKSAYKKNRRDGISFLSVERKNAFYSIFELVCHVLDFALVPYEYRDNNQIFIAERINECRAQFDEAKVEVSQFLNRVLNTITIVDAQVLSVSALNKQLAELINLADRTCCRLESFSAVTGSFAQEKGVSCLADFSRQAAIFSGVYKKISAASADNNLKLIVDLLSELKVGFEEYEAARINMMPHDLELNIDFYVEYPHEMHEVLECLADANFISDVNSLLAQLNDSAISVVRDIENHVDAAEFSINFNIFQAYWFKVQEFEVDVLHKVQEGSCLERVQPLLREIASLSEFKSTMDPNLLHEDMVVCVGEWIDTLIERLDADVGAYTALPINKYAKLLSQQLQWDIELLAKENGANLLTEPLWSPATYEKLHEWRELWGIFWEEAVAKGDHMELWRDKYQQAEQQGVMCLW